MMLLELCQAMHSWVNREYRRGLTTHPCVASVEEQYVICVVAYPYCLRAAFQEVQDPVAERGVQSQGP